MMLKIMRDYSKQIDPFPVDQLKAWFQENAREMPWREKPTPYNVWVSEVMLQQTQVATVIPYFLRWMEHFPTISTLAKAPIEQVLKIWEGLGYYSRARNLHAAAQQLVEKFDGKLPSREEDLAQIKGIGPYTLGAISSFAFHKRAAAVDGNVLRVLARYFGIEESIDLCKTKRVVSELANLLLPESEPWIVAEALIELGATHCQKVTRCEACPLKGGCQAAQHGWQSRLPVHNPRKATTQLKRQVAVIRFGDQFVLRREVEGRVMADLYEFPYIEGKEVTFEHLGLNLVYAHPLPRVVHGFTRFRAELSPHFFWAETPQNLSSPYEWRSINQLNSLPFSAGHRKILSHLLESLR